MKRKITRIEIEEEEDTPDSSSPGEGVVMFIFVLLIVIGLHSMLGRRNEEKPQQIFINQQNNQGTINNDFDDFGNGR